MNKKFNYTKESLNEICKESRSYRQCLSKMNLIEGGGNYTTLKAKIKEFDIDISHFSHQGWNKGNTQNPRRPIEVYLNNEQPIQSFKLKKRLFRENFFERKCMSCDGENWLGKPIPLELHHINGNHHDNSLDNLQILCPNCHAQTDNYRGKNK